MEYDDIGSRNCLTSRINRNKYRITAKSTNPTAYLTSFWRVPENSCEIGYQFCFAGLFRWNMSLDFHKSCYFADPSVCVIIIVWSVQINTESWDLEIWRMTLKNNRAPCLCYFTLCASFHNHRWTQTGVTVQKRPIQVLSNIKFVHHFISICEFKLELWSGNG